uniref:S1 motif domain-containing protein n=1 Tax=Rhabditophanes sp. KR3021 TaxID=114890 RepID=A0AC35TWQ0_9BILA
MNQNYQVRSEYLRALELFKNKEVVVRLLDRSVVEGRFVGMRPNSDHFIVDKITTTNFMYENVCLRSSDVVSIKVKMELEKD